MKKLVSLLLCVVMVFCVTVPTFAADKPIKVKLCNYMDKSGKWVSSKYIKFDVEPIIIDGRTMVPIRAIAEELGYDVGYKDNGKDGFIVSVKKELKVDKNGNVIYKDKNQTLRWINLCYRLEAGNGDYSKNFEFPLGTIQARERGDYPLDIGTHLSSGYPATLTCLLCSKGRISGELFLSGDNVDPLLNYLCVYYNMDVRPQIVNGRTLIPLRALGDLLGLDVSWDDSNKKYNLVTISA